MFFISIFVVEADLHDTSASNTSSKSNSSNNGMSDAHTTINNDNNTNADPTTKNNNAPVKTTSANDFLSAPIPEPEPVPEPSSPETVDDALGPKPEPVPRAVTPGSYTLSTPIFWKALCSSLSAPTNPSI